MTGHPEWCDPYYCDNDRAFGSHGNDAIATAPVTLPESANRGDITVGLRDDEVNPPRVVVTVDGGLSFEFEVSNLDGVIAALTTVGRVAQEAKQ